MTETTDAYNEPPGSHTRPTQFLPLRADPSRVCCSSHGHHQIGSFDRLFSIGTINSHSDLVTRQSFHLADLRMLEDSPPLAGAALA